MTVKDIFSLPDGERAELIDGQIYYMAPLSRTHQQIMGSLYRKIADYIDSEDNSSEVEVAPFAVFLNADDKTCVEPDICVICDSSKVDDQGCNGAPDWIIEIISPGSRHMDYFIKLFKYQSSGVREYWIADPSKGRVTVYNFEKQTFEEYFFEEDIPVGIYEGFQFSLGYVGSWER
ncbi:MAG: Uma2 family endonuclease [Lachnospiraceae bacterium]|nr:Uma2 family endonuclease [Lachnospiraceae bacterium]